MGSKKLLGTAVAAAALAHNVAVEHKSVCPELAAPGSSECPKPDPVYAHIEHAEKLELADARTYTAPAGFTFTPTYPRATAITVSNAATGEVLNT